MKKILIIVTIAISSCTVTKTTIRNDSGTPQITIRQTSTPSNQTTTSVETTMELNLKNKEEQQ